MGMFDYIKCEMELPSKITFDEYQTKGLDCTMDTYIIQENGAIAGLDEWTGQIEFYNSNVSAGAFGQSFVTEGNEFKSVTFLAAVHKGAVVNIEVMEESRVPALSMDDYRLCFEQVPEIQVEINQSDFNIGQDAWLQYGGGDKGRAVKVVYLNNRHVVLEDDDQRIYKEYYPCHLLFHTKEDGLAEKFARTETWRLRTEWCKELLESRIRELEDTK